MEIPTAILIGGIIGGVISFVGNHYIQKRSLSAEHHMQKRSHGQEVERMILSTIHKLDIEYYHSIIQAARTFAGKRAQDSERFSFHWLAIYLTRIRDFRDSVGGFYLKNQVAESVLIYLSDAIENQVDFMNEEEKNLLAAEAKSADTHAEFWEKLEKKPLKDLLKKYQEWDEEKLRELRGLVDTFWRLFITELRWEFYDPWKGELISRVEKDNLELLRKVLGTMKEEKIITKKQAEGFLEGLQYLKPQNL
ncbi:hypothetical protein AKJ53_01030 [candidate division MSBL1 archaeon SCGC-AAA382F02]|uniref:Uncharacterized protein n=1 Tax=candidate division MSBL1 archaeon SCGC-AAA382F02 TaxID=1698282 RepID=A0A133VIC6_9EURY|nr:hypothetical protein AKJ53_01030 [candidate division MSBL1 archaeon SCGC-AAA382F02]